MPFVQFIDIHAEIAHLIFCYLFIGPFLFENNQNFEFSDSVESMNRKLALTIVDGIYVTQILLCLLGEFFIEEVQTSVAMELYAEVVFRLLVGFEEDWAILTVQDDQVVQIYAHCIF